MLSKIQEFADILTMKIHDEISLNAFVSRLKDLIKDAESFTEDSDLQFLASQAFRRTTDVEHSRELYYLNRALDVKPDHIAALTRRAEIYYSQNDYLISFNDILSAEINWLNLPVLDNRNDETYRNIMCFKSMFWSNIEALNELVQALSNYSDSKVLEDATRETRKLNQELETETIKNLTATIEEYRNLLVEHDPEALKCQLVELKHAIHDLELHNKKLDEKKNSENSLSKILWEYSDLKLNYFYINSLIADFYMFREQRPTAANIDSYLHDGRLISKVLMVRAEKTFPQINNGPFCTLKTNTFMLVVATLLARLSSFPPKLLSSESGKLFKETLEKVNKLLHSEENDISKDEVIFLIDTTYKMFYVLIVRSLESIISEINCFEAYMDAVKANDCVKFNGCIAQSDTLLIAKNTWDDINRIKHNSLEALKSLFSIDSEFCNSKNAPHSHFDQCLNFFSRNDKDLSNTSNSKKEMKL